MTTRRRFIRKVAVIVLGLALVELAGFSEVGAVPGLIEDRWEWSWQGHTMRCLDNESEIPPVFADIYTDETWPGDIYECIDTDLGWSCTPYAGVQLRRERGNLKPH